MKVRIASSLVAGIVLGAAGMSLLHVERPPAPIAESVPKPSPASPETAAEQELPPNHPAIAAGDSPHGMQGPVSPAAAEAPAITWKLPAGWQTGANPNAMRLATYHPSSDTEVSVARAGGSTDANIQRWIGQFDDGSPNKRTDETVHGLAVHVVEISGTYSGGGMMPGAPSAPQGGWSLVGAVVETPGSHYFFKLLGPVDRVRASRPSFDALIASITPG